MRTNYGTETKDGAWLKSQRLASGLVPKEFARAIGVSRQTVWRYETRGWPLPNWLTISAASVAKKSEKLQ
jgi:transcriptional regulator with XRE-family HTH domain